MSELLYDFFSALLQFLESFNQLRILLGNNRYIRLSDGLITFDSHQFFFFFLPVLLLVLITELSLGSKKRQKWFCQVTAVKPLPHLLSSTFSYWSPVPIHFFLFFVFIVVYYSNNLLQPFFEIAFHGCLKMLYINLKTTFVWAYLLADKIC